MKKIQLTKGKFALVDDKDFEYLNQWRWLFSDTGYALRHQHINIGLNKYKSKTIRMHRLINKTPDGFETDHINRNKLDNQKINLRTITHQKNSFNTGLRRSNTSGYKGVYWDKFNNKWRAEIKINNKKISLGRFKNIKDALFAREVAERIYHAI